MVLGEMKIKLGKNLFKKLNVRSKELQGKQEEINKKHNLLST
jgi:putative reticulocyte binding protein 2